MNTCQELFSLGQKSPCSSPAKPVLALARLAETLLTAAGADAILPETKLGDGAVRIGSGTRGCVFPPFKISLANLCVF